MAAFGALRRLNRGRVARSKQSGRTRGESNVAQLNLVCRCGAVANFVVEGASDVVRGQVTTSLTTRVIDSDVRCASPVRGFNGLAEARRA